MAKKKNEDLESMAISITESTRPSNNWLKNPKDKKKIDKMLDDLEELFDLHHDTDRPEICLNWVGLCRALIKNYNLPVKEEAVKRALKTHYGRDRLREP